LAFASDNDTLAQCSAKCTELGCTCYDYLSSLLPPGPPPFDWSRTLTLQNSPFWTLTPSYSEQIHVRDLRILAPMDRIGNTDGVNIDSSRDVLVENVYIKNSDDGVCIKSGLDGLASTSPSRPRTCWSEILPALRAVVAASRSARKCRAGYAT
jgi:hypothetical protein